MAKLRVRESEIKTKEQRRKFMLLFGRDALEQATHKMGLKRIGPQKKIKELTNELEATPTREEKKSKELTAKIQSLLSDTEPNMDKDIEVEIGVSDNRVENSKYFHDTFMEVFDDEDRLLDVLGIPEEYRAAGKNNYFKMQDAEPHVTRVSETKKQTLERAKKQKKNGIKPFDPEEVG